MKENLKYPLAIKKNYFYIQLIERFTKLAKNEMNSNKNNSLLVLDEVNYYLKNASVKSKMIENKDNKRSIAVAIMFMESEREA